MTSPQAVTDLVAGRVSMLVVDRGPALPHLISHSIRALMVTTRERSRLLPDVPSAREAGVPELDLDSWVALFAPANTPKDIVDRLSGELRRLSIIQRSGTCLQTRDSKRRQAPLRR